MREEGVVGSSEVLVSAKVNQANVENELDNLHCRKVLLPPETSSTGGCVVVIVHNNMDCKVLGDDRPRDASSSIQLGVAEQSGGRVVEDVKELQRFLLERKENGIDEFQILEVIIYHIIEFHPRSPRTFTTQCGMETMIPHYWNNLLQHESQEQQAARAEDDIVCLEDGR